MFPLFVRLQNARHLVGVTKCTLQPPSHKRQEDKYLKTYLFWVYVQFWTCWHFI